MQRQISLVSTLVEKPISEHPDFYRARFDWGVKPAWIEETEDGDIISHPADWSTHMPEHDGKSLSDFMGGDGVLRAPGAEGISFFLAADLQWVSEP